VLLREAGVLMLREAGFLELSPSLVKNPRTV
jgi:hypothetical protein